MPVTKKLENKLKNLPKEPGVYQFKDKTGTIIYIGKAKVLKNRVRSYFQKNVHAQPKTGVMVKKIAELDYIITDTEKEALILEANLIKLYRPRYNISMKDDKSFPYIKITKEDFPQIFPTRKKLNDGGTYYGPYTEVRVMRSLLWTMKKVFPIRSCQLRMTPKTISENKHKICLDYHIKRCGGPCEGFVSKEEYGEMVKNIKSFLSGHTKALTEILNSKMLEEASHKRFESAAVFRDRLKEIKNFQSKQKIVDSKDIDRDIVSIFVEDDIASGVVFQEREGKILGRKHFPIEGVGGKERAVILQNFVMQYYMGQDYIPPEILINEEIEEILHITEWLTDRRTTKVSINVPKIGDKLKLINMCLKNAELMVGELLLMHQQRKDYVAFAVKTLQKDLGLENLPMVIEAFDISNIQGTNPIASMVYFKNGAPLKSSYRYYKIRVKDTPDDFAMMNEVVERRYTRLLAEDADLPDLILIDGGKGQLSSAFEALQKVGVPDIPIIGLAKRLDEVYIPEVSDPQNIDRTSPGLRLLQRVRDEAHRFAITNHRKQRKKRTLTSELDVIPGIGPERRIALLKYFGSVAKIKAATPESMTNIKTINLALAKTILEHLNGKKEKKVK